MDKINTSSLSPRKKLKSRKQRGKIKQKSSLGFSPQKILCGLLVSH
jgi:hypothetical protein